MGGIIRDNICVLLGLSGLALATAAAIMSIVALKRSNSTVAALTDLSDAAQLSPSARDPRFDVL